MFKYGESTLVNARKQTLHTVSYVPSTAPIATIIWHHGYGEHVGRAGYKQAFGKLASSGIAVYSFDAHGHGKSEPKETRDRAVIWRFSDLVDDLYLVADHIKQQLPNDKTPMFLAGASMGGLVACHSLLARQSMWSGLILVAALVDVNWTLALRLQAPIVGIVGRITPRARIVPAVRAEDMCTDPKVVQDYLSDPLNTVGNVPVRTSSSLLGAFRALGGMKSKLTVPILAAHGTDDRCTSLPAVKNLLQGAASQDKTVKEYEGAYHDLLQGPQGDDCTQLIIKWVTEHAAGDATASGDGSSPAGVDTTTDDSSPAVADTTTNGSSLAGVDTTTDGSSPAGVDTTTDGSSPAGAPAEADDVDVKAATE